MASEEDHPPLMINFQEILDNYHMLSAQNASLKEELKKYTGGARDEASSASSSAPPSLQDIQSTNNEFSRCIMHTQPVTAAEFMRQIGQPEAAAGFERAWVRHNIDTSTSSEWDVYFGNWLRDTQD